MSDYNPLVSIVVIACNSCKYVRETLESAKMQTYRNIELIVTDDGSTDATVDICRKWLEANGDRFVRTELITAARNTGIPANCNRGYKACKGEWIKGIAGDDALLPDCIQDYIDFIQGRPEIGICHSSVEVYRDILDEEHFLYSGIRRKKLTLPSLSAHEQYKLLYRGSVSVMSPSVFVKTNLIKQMGYFNEDFPFCDDWPLWLKITHAGYKFFFLNKNTVKYRLSNVSVCHVKSDRYIPKRENDIYEFLYKTYLEKEVASVRKWRIWYRLKLYRFLEKHNCNTRNKLHSLLFYVLYFPLSVCWYYDYIYFNGWRICFSRLKTKILGRK